MRTEIHDCLARFLGYASRTRVALTGSIAMGWHFDRRRIQWAQRDAHDIDFVTDSPHNISPQVTTEFLVSHYHVPSARSLKFLLQLVHPPSRIRVDIFPESRGSIEDAPLQEIAGMSLRVLSLQSILRHKLDTLAKASSDRPVDPKHYADAVLLAEELGETPYVISTAALATDSYSQDVASRCPRCELSRSPAFPLAPKQSVYDVLGYV